MNKKRFYHTVLIHAMNSEKIVQFQYSGDMHLLSAAIDNKFPTWENAYYQDLESGNVGQIFKRARLD
jgi:hypothetical protein